MKKKLKETINFVAALLLIAAMMYGTFAVYADAVGHPLNFLGL